MCLWFRVVHGLGLLRVLGLFSVAYGLGMFRVAGCFGFHTI